MTPIMPIFFAAVLACSTLGAAEQIAPDLSGAKLREFLREHFTPRKSLSYKAARKQMFSTIDNKNGQVRLVYTGTVFATTGIPDHTIVNTEHTWPQSKFGSSSDSQKMKTDLHHLFPTHNRVNSARGNLRFAEIPDKDTQKWWISASARNGIPKSQIDEYSESTDRAFEPREDHKGNVARAMLYFYVIYEDRGIDTAWFKPQAKTLRNWNALDRVNESERERSRKIGRLQGNQNPFVLDPTLVDRVLRKTSDAKPKPDKSASAPKKKKRSN